MRRWSYVLAAIFALAFAYDLTRIPVQVSDSLGDMLEAQAEPSAAAMFVKELGRPGMLRPLKAAQIRIVSDVSQGHYSLAYRGMHVLLLVLTIWTFVQVLQVKTGVDLAAAAFALTVLLGLHTFSNLLREAFPINHFLEMVLFALIALRLAQRRPGWMTDAAAALLFAAGALIIESGLLVWVVIVAARLSGMRGISRRGVVMVSLLFCAYAYVRFVVLSTGLPAVEERSSGFFLRVLEPDEIRERFGGNPLPYYAYNVIAAFSGVLFSEPRAGLWVAAGRFFQGNLAPWVVVPLVSSAATTLLIGVAAVVWWRNRPAGDEADRFFVIAAAVVAANAVLSFGYLKDDILSVAGAFYALAAYSAVRRLIPAVLPMRTAATTAFCVVMLLASAGFAIRTAGLHYSLRAAAFKTRNDWTAVPARWTARPDWRAVTERLQADAFERRIVAPRFEPAWQARWFEE